MPAYFDEDDYIDGGSFGKKDPGRWEFDEIIRPSETTVVWRDGGTWAAPQPILPAPSPFKNIHVFNDFSYHDENGDGNWDWYEFKRGTLNGLAGIDKIDQLIGRDKLIFSTQDHDTPNYVRNINRAVPNADLTCISPWNSTQGGLQTATPVSKRFGLCPAHYGLATGSTFRLVTKDNEVVERTIINHTVIGPSVGEIRVLEWSVDLPDTITPAQVMPADWDKYLGETGGQNLTGFYIDQEEKLLAGYISSLGTVSGGELRIRKQSYSPFEEFWEPLMGGDSGNQIFLIINNRVVLLAGFFHKYGTTGGGGPPFHLHMAEIEEVTGTLDKPDLSGLTVF